MQADTIDAVWLESDRELSLSELSELSGLPEQVLRELVDYGALVPTARKGGQWTIDARFVLALRTAGRLCGDLELDPQSLALALTLIGRVRELEAEVCRLRAQLPHESA